MSMYPLQPSFAAGELTPSLWGRVDMAKYNVGLKVCENWIIHPHGGVSRRNGMRYIAPALAGSRLIPFIYNETTAYILELGDKVLRVLKDGVLTGVTVTTPYAVDDVWDLSYAQSADVLYLCHKDYPPMELSRWSEDRWTLVRCNFTPPPFATQTEEQSQVKFTPSDISGAVTLTASSAVFASDMVGSAVALIQHADEVQKRINDNAVDHKETWSITATVGMVRQYKGQVESGGENSQLVDSWSYWLTVSKKIADQLTVGDAVEIGRGSGHISEIVAVTESNSDGGKKTVGKYESGHVGEYAISAKGLSFAWVKDGDKATFSHEGIKKGVGNWIVQVTVYKSWRLESSGFWAGTVHLQRYDKDEGRWVTMKTYTSQESESSARNYSDSGTFDEVTQLRLVSDDFVTFIPEDNVPQDRGYFILTAEETDHLGWGTITEYISPTQVKVDVEEPFVSTTGTALWQFGAWSAARGYPRAVGFYQERLCFGGSIAEPQTVWMSKTGDYYNFGTSSPTLDDDSITATMAARQVNVIRHFVGLGSLIVLTSGSEWLISADGALTPTNINAKPQGYRGCTGLNPIVVGNQILFVQSQGYRVRDLGYAYESDSYTGNDVTIMASHMLRTATIKDWAYQQEPDSMAWIVRTDGALLSLTYMKEHDVYAWARHPTDGNVESVACVPGDYGGDVYLIVTRGGKRGIERMCPEVVTTAADGYYLDGGTSIKGAAVKEVTGLAHLAGCKVDVLADGKYLGQLAVSDAGTVTLPRAAKVVHVGLPYQSKLRTLDLGFQRDDGTQLTRRSRVAAVALVVENARALWAGVDEEHLQECRELADSYGPTGLADCHAHVSLSSSYVDWGGGSAWVETKLPYPASVLGIVPEVSAGG